MRAEGRDEDELVLEPVVGVLGHRVVEQDRAGLRGDELVGLLEDLAQETVDLDLARVGVVGLVPLEEVLEPAVFESEDLQHGAASKKFYHLIPSTPWPQSRDVDAATA